jgi:hypothetical protein
VSSQFTESEVSQDASLEAERSCNSFDEDIGDDEPIDNAGESLKEKLASWQVENHIPHIQCDKLLRIIKPYHPELPKCTKTLVQTDRNKVQLLEVPPGYYKHFGIRNGLVKVFEMLSVGQTIRGVLPIFVGIDDLKLHNSSTSQFTAIVGFIPSFPDSPPFEIGVFHAYSKAQSSNVLLTTFITEAVLLYDAGFEYNGENVRVKISALICDAPARATVTCTKGHASDLYGCSKCTGSGVNIGQLRTNQSFRDKECGQHHHEASIVENLFYFDMVNDVPLDPMHLFDIGIMRRLLSFLFGSKRGRNIRRVTLPNATQISIDIFLVSLRKYISRLDFARQPKSIKHLGRWKASELRIFLHYLGVVVLKPYLPKAFYDHFLCLHVAVKLLSCVEWCVNDNEQAKCFLRRFVRQSERLYTMNFLSYNVHALLHVADDVLRFGPLYSYSAYRFENHYGLMKKYLRKNDKPLQQLVKRLDEEKRNSLPSEKRLENGSINFTNIHVNGPINLNAEIVVRQFKRAEKIGVWQVTCEEPDNCIFLNDLSVVIIRNFVETDRNQRLVIGQKFLVQENHFDYPVPSSDIYEFKVSTLSEIQAWNISDVMCKAVKLPSSFPHGLEFVVFPLLRE